MNIINAEDYVWNSDESKSLDESKSSNELRFSDKSKSLDELRPSNAKKEVRL